MLDLDSPRWLELECAGASVPKLIKSLAEAPNEEDWVEVWGSVAHSLTLYPAAYAALPHLLSLVKAQGLTRDPETLLNLGSIAAPIGVVAPCPDDLRSAFEAALTEARVIAVEAASSGEYEDDEDYACALQAAAALDGRRGPGIHLWDAVRGLEVELNCPACDAYLNGELAADSLHLQVMDERLKPLSEKVRCVPRKPRATDVPEGRVDDFTWLTGLCRRAGRLGALAYLSQLYGTGSCPRCAACFGVMDEVCSQGYLEPWTGR